MLQREWRSSRILTALIWIDDAVLSSLKFHRVLVPAWETAVLPSGKGSWAWPWWQQVSSKEPLSLGATRDRTVCNRAHWPLSFLLSGHTVPQSAGEMWTGDHNSKDFEGFCSQFLKLIRQACHVSTSTQTSEVELCRVQLKPSATCPSPCTFTNYASFTSPLVLPGFMLILTYSLYIHCSLGPKNPLNSLPTPCAMWSFTFEAFPPSGIDFPPPLLDLRNFFYSALISFLVTPCYLYLLLLDPPIKLLIVPITPWRL